MSPPVLEVQGLQVALRSGTSLVKGVSFALAPGTVTGLAGTSGSGKTLTSLALMGLADPSLFAVNCEQMTLNGVALDPARPESLRRHRGHDIAMVFQDPVTALDPVFTVGAQLERTLRRHLPQADARGEALEALAEVGFTEPASIHGRHPHELSGGMRQLCVIALAQALRPRVLIADEPTTALDAMTQALVLDRLMRLARESATAILFITHDLRLLHHHADEVLVMSAGQVVDRTRGEAIGDPAEADTLHPCTRELLASLPRLRPPPARPLPSSPPVLALRDVQGEYHHRAGPWRRQQRHRAVRGVSLDLHRGRMTGLAGASGSGKSTLARLVVRLLQATGGDMTLDGASLLGLRGTGDHEARRRIQLVFQDPAAALSPRRTVAETLREAARHFQRDDGRDGLVEALRAVGLDESALERRPRAFSSGQRQRIALARALVCEPDVLIADEALSALDVAVQAQVLEVLRSLRDDRGLAILLVSHDLAVLAEQADDIAVMYRGRLVEQAPAARLFDAPAHPYTRQLIDALPRFGPEPAARATPFLPQAGLDPQQREAPGCLYRLRCPVALPRCADVAPRPVIVEAGHRHTVECHLHDPAQPQGTLVR